MPTPPPVPTHPAASPRRGAPPESEILIVGAGPVGLTAAIELARRGVRCRVLDVEPAGAPAAAPGAAAARDEDCEPVLLHPRTLESLATLGGGVLAALQHKGRQVRGLRLYSGGHLAGRVTTASAGGPFPFGLTLPLSELCAALRVRAAELAVPIEAAPALAAVEQDGDAVHVLVGPGGAARRLSAAYLIVCDGADSAARRLLGVAVEEHRYGERALLAEAPLGGGQGGAARALGAGADDEILAFFSVQGPLTLTPLLGPGRVRVLAPVAPELPPTPAALQALFSARATLGSPGASCCLTGAARCTAATAPISRARSSCAPIAMSPTAPTGPTPRRCSATSTASSRRRPRPPPRSAYSMARRKTSQAGVWFASAAGWFHR